MKEKPALRIVWIAEDLHAILELIKHQTGIPISRLASDAIREKYNKKPLTRAAKHNEI